MPARIFHFFYSLFRIVFLVCFSYFIYFQGSSHGESNMPSWHLLGPGDADMVTSIAMTESNDLYVGTDVGGLFYSKDYGDSWKPINHGLKNHDITTPVVSDIENENILYVGTRGGFYKSLNKGTTWKAKWNGLPGPLEYRISSPIGAIAIHPEKPSTIYMGFGYRPDTVDGAFLSLKSTWNGIIYRSRDKGESWKPLSRLQEGTAIHRIEFLPENPSIILLATNKGAYKSCDGGESWQKIKDGDIRFIICHPSKKNLIFLSSGPKGIFSSSNCGDSWTAVNDGLSVGGKNNYSVLCFSADGQELYLINSTWASKGGFYKKRTDDIVWHKMTYWLWKNSMPAAWLSNSKRINAIAVNPKDTSNIFIGSSRYIYSTNDRGKTWKQLISTEVTEGKWTHRGLNVFGGTPAVAIDPTNKDRIYVGTTDHGLLISDDEGKSWYPATKGMVYKSTIKDIVIDKQNPNNVYVINMKGLTRYHIAKSNNFGETWEERYEGLKDNNRLNCLLLDPDNKDYIFAGGKGGVFLSKNDGKLWARHGTGLIQDIEVRHLERHSLKKKTIFAATSKGLYKSKNNGKTWRQLSHRTSLDCYTVLSSLNDADTLFLGTRKTRTSPGGLFKSTDGGISWRQVLDVRWASGILQIPSTNIFYTITNDHNYHDESGGEGVFRSVNGGQDWDQINEGLAVLRAHDIAISSSEKCMIYLATGGSGVYRQAVAPCSSGPN